MPDADGTLYVGSGTQDVTDEPQNIGKLYALVDKGDHAENQVDFRFRTRRRGADARRHGDDLRGLRGDLDATPPIPGRVVALRDTGESAEIIWSVEASGEIWLAAPVIGPDNTLYFADAVCIDYETCDEDTDIPSVYAIKEVQYRIYLPVVLRNAGLQWSCWNSRKAGTVGGIPWLHRLVRGMRRGSTQRRACLESRSGQPSRSMTILQTWWPTLTTTPSSCHERILNLPESLELSMRQLRGA